MRAAVFVGVAAAAICFAAPAAGQNRAEAERLVYEATFFETFSPTNALQMVERLPGFTLESGAFGVRGFGQAAGNVVINGQRPSSKSDTLSVILSRIPASRVLRIEVASGNSFGADYAGKPQVANVMLSDEGGLAGTVEAKLAREFTGSILPTVGVSVLVDRGDLSFNAAAKLQNFMSSEDGFDRLETRPGGEVIASREVFNRSREPYKTASIGIGHEPAPDRSAHLNAKISIDPWNMDQTSEGTFGNGREGSEVFTMRHLWKTYEISGDVTRPLFAGAIKLNALATRRDRDNSDTVAEYAEGDLIGGIAQDMVDTLDEAVARLAWTRPMQSGWMFEIGGEGAFNELRSETDFFTIDAANERTRVELPIDDATVTEYRGEAFANAGHDLSANLHAAFGLTFEASRLSVTGDVQARRSLQFLKPRASMDWRSGAWHAQFSVERTVAQLVFADFVSGADVNYDRVNGGNAELVPQRAWEFLFSADRTLLGDGRIKVDLGYDHISMLQDRVPTPDGFDAPGNLGNGSRWTARGNLDLPLSRFAIEGGRLSLQGTYIDTSVIDPYTLLDRHFSGAQLFAYTANFRQDLGMFAWGVEAKGNTGSISYRRNELDKLQNVSPNVSAFVEYGPNEALTATLGVENLFDAPVERWRDMFAPDRTSLAPTRAEYRERNSHMLWYVSLRRSFGA